MSQLEERSTLLEEKYLIRLFTSVNDEGMGAENRVCTRQGHRQMMLMLLIEREATLAIGYCHRQVQLHLSLTDSSAFHIFER